jgi:hypothetical protein
LRLGLPGIGDGLVTSNRIYQIIGINRNRVFLQYAVYPGRFLDKNFSSSKSLHIMTIKIKTTKNKSQKEPKAIGVKSNMSSAPEYMGWRTTAYGPVEITVWFSVISIMAEVKLFSIKKMNTIRNQSTVKISPTITK